MLNLKFSLKAEILFKRGKLWFEVEQIERDWFRIVARTTPISMRRKKKV